MYLSRVRYSSVDSPMSRKIFLMKRTLTIVHFSREIPLQTARMSAGDRNVEFPMCDHVSLLRRLDVSFSRQSVISARVQKNRKEEEKKTDIRGAIHETQREVSFKLFVVTRVGQPGAFETANLCRLHANGLVHERKCRVCSTDSQHLSLKPYFVNSFRYLIS